ncbi:unnamed protein product, partial [marine sediment metagenome]
LPFLWMLSTSLKPSNQIFIFPPKWIPHPFKWSNYPEGWTILPFTTFLKNTTIITGLSVLGNLISCSLVAFAFARLRCHTRNFLFMLMLSTMMIPYQVIIIPQFIIFKTLNWIDTFKPLIVPAWLGYPFFIFLLRQFFMTIPFELDDAAKIDGCSALRIYWSIMLPLSKPALAAVAIFSFVGNWNNFMGPLIYLSSAEKYTLALGLQLFQGQYMIEMGLLMAASVLVLLPIIIVFFFAQKYFIQGITLTGLKG